MNRSLSRFSNLVYSSLAYALMGVAGFSLQPTACNAEDVTVGAWNIEWLGYPNMRGRPGKDIEQSAEDLAKWIHDSGVEVLSLEEIGVDSVDTRRSAKLDETFKTIKEKYQQDWQYILFPKTKYTEPQEDFTIRGQYVGLAWQTKRASIVGEPFHIDVGANETFGYKFFERQANAIKLSFGEGKTDVVFIPVHLKSNRNEKQDTDPNWTKKHRTAEAKALVEKLGDLKSALKDSDIVILGDFNLLADDDEPAKALIEGGFTDLNQADEGTTANWGEGYSSAPFDRIFIPTGQPEFAQSKLTIVRGGPSDDEIKTYRRKHSDHYLVKTTISIIGDDD